MSPVPPSAAVNGRPLTLYPLCLKTSGVSHHSFSSSVWSTKHAKPLNWGSHTFGRLLSFSPKQPQGRLLLVELFSWWFRYPRNTEWETTVIRYLVSRSIKMQCPPLPQAISCALPSRGPQSPAVEQELLTLSPAVWGHHAQPRLCIRITWRNASPPFQGLGFMPAPPPQGSDSLGLGRSCKWSPGDFNAPPETRTTALLSPVAREQSSDSRNFTTQSSWSLPLPCQTLHFLRPQPGCKRTFSLPSPRGHICWALKSGTCYIYCSAFCFHHLTFFHA